MADVAVLLVGEGITPGPSFALGHLVYVSNVGPPGQLTSYGPVRALDGLVEYTGVPSAAGTYPATVGATEPMRIVGGLIVQGEGATDSVTIGRGATAKSGSLDQVIIGRGASVGNNGAQGVVLIGATANGSGGASVVVGFNSGSGVANGVGGVFVGNAAQASGNGGGASVVVIGDNTLITLGGGGGGGGVAIGFSSNIAHPSGVAIGYSAQATFSSALGQNTVTIGDTTLNTRGGTTLVGGASQITAANASVFGSGSNATAAGAITIGQGSTNAGVDTILIGRGGALTTAGQIAIGAGAADLGAGFAQLGASGTPITTLLLGAGNTIASPAAKTIRFTNASGSDNAAADVTIIAPRSTGAAVPGKFIIQVGVLAGSSATLQSATTALTIDGASGAPISNFAAQVGIGAPGQANNGLLFGGALSSNATRAVSINVGTTGALTATANNVFLQHINLSNKTLVGGGFTGVTWRGIWLNSQSVATLASPGDPSQIYVDQLDGTGATNASAIVAVPPIGAINNYLFSHSTPGIFNVSSTGTMVLGGAGNAITLSRVAGNDTTILIDAPSATNTSQIAFSSSGVLKWQMGRGASDGSDNYIIYNNNTASAAVVISTASNAVKLTSLAGIGSRPVFAAADGTLSA